jgi:predicted amidophosphoribosyltransferase
MINHEQDYRHEFLIKYQEKENKDLLRDIKLLDSKALDRGAELLYRYICIDKGRILLLHAPSSAYAKGERKVDQVLEMLKRIGKIDAQIDILPHFFILNYDRRDAQHEADRATRIENARSKFKIFLDVPDFFIKKYDRIYIIDDVSTTGHTLHALLELMKTSYPAIAERVRTLSIAH